MLACPSCSRKLYRTKSSLGVLWVCPSCNGRFVNMTLIRRTSARMFLSRLWNMIREGRHARGRRCPSCTHHMAEVTLPSGGKDLALDICRVCQFVWFDPGEYQRMTGAEIAAGKPETLGSSRVDEEVVELDQDPADWPDDTPATDLPPGEWWELLIGAFGMPVEDGQRRLSRVPLATLVLAGACVLVSILGFLDLEPIVQWFGMIPSRPLRHGGLTFISSFFLHAGWLHLISNVYFLLVFGDDVEEYVGWWRFLLLILAATVTGDLLSILLDHDSTIPSIGASGGISGIMAFYALKFPHRRIAILIYVLWLRMPAWVAMLLWVALQVLGAFGLAGESNIGYLAHMGGAVAGVVLWLFFRKR